MLTPAETARTCVEIGKKKAALAAAPMFLLAVLAGAYIGLAGVAATFGNVYVNKVMGAAIFPAGLAMVIVAGSELFTGNSLMSVALLEREITLQKLLRNWLIVYAGNLLGGLLVAALTVLAGTFGGVYETVVATAQAKVSLPFGEALLRGVLCNVLVCVAVWMTFAAQTAGGKIAALYLPILAFVLCGFEHSVANMFYIPAGIFAATRYGVDAGLTVGRMWLGNLIPVTLGNVLGGCAVGAVYWRVYLKKK